MASCLTKAADVGIGGDGLILGHLITHLHHDVSTCQALLGLHLTRRRGDADLRCDRRDTGVLKFGRWASENEVYMSQNGNCYGGNDDINHQIWNLEFQTNCWVTMQHLRIHLQKKNLFQDFKPSMAEMVPVADAKNWLLLLWLPSGYTCKWIQLIKRLRHPPNISSTFYSKIQHHKCSR